MTVFDHASRAAPRIVTPDLPDGPARRHRQAWALMGHPPGAVVLPSPAHASLAPAVERIEAWWGGRPDELAALLRAADDDRDDQLAAVAWVFDRASSHVLLVDHRSYGWSCPGGHVEQGETAAAAAGRELAEETGLVLEPVTADPVTLTLAHTGDHRHWIVGYRFEADRRRRLAPERDPVAWHRVDDLPPVSVPDLATLVGALTTPARGRRMRRTPTPTP
jgi:8-oxo-dGTP diphosphatase